MRNYLRSDRHTFTSHRSGGRYADAGQVSILVVLAVGTFLLMFVGFGVDLTNLFFHRQAAQGAADAACVAAGMDMLKEQAVGGCTDSSGTAYQCGGNSFTPVAPPASIDCSGKSTIGNMSSGSGNVGGCVYAAMNGYSSPGLTAGKESNDVQITFPKAVPGAVDPNTIVNGIVSFPFVQVSITDRVQVYFASLLSGTKTQDVAAIAKCGLQLIQSPVPLLVLDPRDETSVTANGAFTINIYGGPPRSIQINSSSTSAYAPKGCSKGGFNLQLGGPSTTGSDVGITGAESANCWVAGTTSTWNAPDSPISDPFATVCAPGQATACLSTINGYSAPGVPPNAPPVGFGALPGGVDGCPTGTTCDHYQAGKYNGGISVGPGASHPAVFDPGLYYVKGGMSLLSNSQVCTGTALGDGTGGVMFYFADSSSIKVWANSGGGQCTNSTGGTLTAADIKCTGASILPGNMPLTQVLSGNILLAPCTGYYGDPVGAKDPAGVQRGFLFFQDRDTSASAQWGGGGAFTLAGNMYFHYCDSSTTALSGINCNFTSGYTTSFQLGGGSGSGTYVYGNIVTDQLDLHGNPNITMDLNPIGNYYIFKVALLQ